MSLLAYSPSCRIDVYNPITDLVIFFRKTIPKVANKSNESTFSSDFFPAMATLDIHMNAHDSPPRGRADVRKVASPSMRYALGGRHSTLLPLLLVVPGKRGPGKTRTRAPAVEREEGSESPLPPILENHRRTASHRPMVASQHALEVRCRKLYLRNICLYVCSLS